MNTVASAVFITGVLAPLVAVSYGLPGPIRGFAAVLVSLIWILAALGIHLLGANERLPRYTYAVPSLIVATAGAIHY